MEPAQDNIWREKAGEMESFAENLKKSVDKDKFHWYNK